MIGRLTSSDQQSQSRESESREPSDATTSKHSKHLLTQARQETLPSTTSDAQSEQTTTTAALKQYIVPESRGLLPKERDQLKQLFQTHRTKELSIPEKRVSFEVLSVEKVAMYANFTLTEDFIKEMKASFVTVFDPDYNQWVFSLCKYLELVAFLEKNLPTRPIMTIPDFVTQLVSNSGDVPFENSEGITHPYDYKTDFQIRPRLSSLPKKLFQSLYSF